LRTAGKNYGAESVKSDLYIAIDDVQNSVVRKIVTYKDKKRSLFKKGALKAKAILKGLNFKKNG